MFLKLLKHDMKAVWRMWWLFLVVIPPLSIVASLLVRYLTENADQTTNILYVFAMFAVMLIFGLYIATFFYTIILVFLRFYKNLFTDEAYLTFTLPAKRSTVLLAKTVNAMFWYIAHAIVLFIGFLPVFLIGPPTEGEFLINPVVFSTFWDGLCTILREGPVWIFLIYVLEILILSLLSTFSEIVLIQFCITFGATVVKKAKLVLGLGMYYGISTIMSFVLEFVMIFGIFFGATGILQLMPDPSDAAVYALGGLILAAFCAIAATWGATLYFTTRNIIERKLNLA